MKTQPLFPRSAHCWRFPALLAILAVGGCTSTPSHETKTQSPPTAIVSPVSVVADDSAHSQKFARWVSQFRAVARAAGISEATLDLAFANVRFIPRVIELDRRQPEFTRAIWDYLDSSLSTPRIHRGQDKLQQLRPVAAVIAAR